MLVDDSSIVTNMVSSYLSSKGYQVSVSNSPFGVSNKVKEFKPQVILMDLGLPGLSGEQLIRVCREKEDCRVVLFSSTDEDVMKDMVGRGVANDYFLKGGSLKDLEDKIRAQARTLVR